MDKKSIVNDLYQAVVMSIFTVGYSMLEQKDTEDDISKAGCYHYCVRDDKRVSHQTEDYTGAP